MHAADAQFSAAAAPAIDAAQEIARYVECVFEADRPIEVRTINASTGKAVPEWIDKASDLAAHAPGLKTRNVFSCVYAGANHRRGMFESGDGAVERALVLWADFDGVTADDVLMRIDSLGLPRPTLIIFTGHGVHCYWRLTAPITDLAQWRAMQEDIAAALDSDPVVCNPERIMRLPGFVNHKENDGAVARIIEADPARQYTFDQLRAIVPTRPRPVKISVPSNGNHGPRDDAGQHWLQKALSRVVPGDGSLGRNQTGFWFAAQLRDAGVSASEAELWVLKYAADVPAHSHPYTTRAALASLRQAYKRPAREPAMSRTPRQTAPPPPPPRHRAENGPSSEILRNANLRTDIGNACRLIKSKGSNLLFCKQTGNFYTWTSKLWLPDDVLLVQRWAQDTALAIFDEAKDAQDEDTRKEVAKWAVKSQQHARLIAMVNEAKCHVAVTYSQLDADQMILNVRNGTVDLRTGQLRAHTRSDYITKICRADYRRDAVAPVFKGFLARIFRTSPSLIDYVQKVLGYAITGSTREQVLFFLYGAGSNGKTTLLDAVQHVLAEYATKAVRELLDASQSQHCTSVTDLFGRRLVICSETNEGARIDEAKLKDLVGETKLKGRNLYCPPIEGLATHKLFLYSNHKPVVRGTDFGFWRRIRLIPFVETITDAEKDTELPDKLRAEADGILAWLVEGCLRWQSEGLGLPNEVKQATADYRSEMDSIGAFISECCWEESGLESASATLYRAYTAWAEQTGERPASQKRLAMQFRERGLKDQRSGLGHKKWLGICLNPEWKARLNGQNASETQNASEIAN